LQSITVSGAVSVLFTVYVPSDFLCGMETVALPSGPTVTGWPTTPFDP
jgi:hypothetical protein